jgi:hypothetical protein
MEKVHKNDTSSNKPSSESFSVYLLSIFRNLTYKQDVLKETNVNEWFNASVTAVTDVSGQPIGPVFKG